MSIEEQLQAAERISLPAAGPQRPVLQAMLEATSIALVGASPRPGSFGHRMIAEVARSPAGPDIYLVNPRHRQIGERPCYPSLAELPGPVDLVLLGVPDAALEQQLSLAAGRSDAAAVIFGNAHEEPLPAPPAGPPGRADGRSGRADGRTGPAGRGSGPADGAPGPADGVPGRPDLRKRLAAIARGAGMDLCGAGCMGFVNVARGLRAIGYVEPDQLPAGPVALVTHSGSVFSAMLRSHRAIGFTLAVSSGQELVTTAAAYLEYALGLPETRVLALVLEAMREPGRLRAALASAAARDIPVVLLTVGSSAKGQAMVAAHSGALAAQNGGWEALADAYGVHRVGDLAELADTLELFAIGRRVRPPAPAVPPVPADLPAPSSAELPAPASAQQPAPASAEPPSPVRLPTTTAPPTTVSAPTPPTTVSAPTSPSEGDGCAHSSPWKVMNAHIHPAGMRVHPAGIGVHAVRMGQAGQMGRAEGTGRAERTGIATVHDSGLERAHTADLAEELGVPYATIGEPTLARLADVLDPGLQPANPLDVWGTGGDAERQLTDALVALADDPAVAAVALAVDLVHEFDGDRSYPGAVLAAAGRTAKPLAVLAGLASAVDPDVAAELRRAGVPVLEGTRTGLLALRHLLDHANRGGRAALANSVLPGDDQAAEVLPGDEQAVGVLPGDDQAAEGLARHEQATGDLAGRGRLRPWQPDEARRARGAALLAAGQAAGAPLLSLLREYGIAAARSDPAADLDTALAAAAAIGYPVVLKTAEPEILHKSDAGGVILGIRDPAELAAAYRDLSARLGPRVLVCESVPPGTELALGIARDADLGPLVVVGAGGVLVELLADRAVALPPVDEDQARRMIGRLRAGRLLAGIRGAPPADSDAVIRAITGLSALAVELGGELEALDVNPLICGPAGAVAVDALMIPREGRLR